MKQQTLEPYFRILTKYRLEPDFIEDYGKIKKVYTKQGIFALKEVRYSEEQRNRFMQAVNRLHDKGYRHVVPIYLSSDGRHLQSDNSSGCEFYLMPWIDNGQVRADQRFVDLMREAARIHKVTEVTGKANHSYFQHFYEKSIANIDKRKLDYERFIEKSEQKIYMSPFELLYCTHFVQLMRMEDFVLNTLVDWYEATKEKNKDRISICHGNLSPNHILYDERGYSYLFNFDRTFRASPIYDLLDFFRKALYRYPQKAAEAVGWYKEYSQNHQLTDDERLLLFYYLTQTDNIHRIIHQYQTDPSISEKNIVVKLQRSIWQMQAAHSLVTQINEGIQQEKNEALFAEDNGGGGESSDSSDSFVGSENNGGTENNY
ncbi:spore coat protein YsxE [Schinkia azotoformans MEV2011]|uniref:Spore coat protein YsxE n=1 Tax=Schinkia azotoformans MEV2011 TaxID=1348973 RepID=A0A072NRF1_SCHAZ|nr:spore coat protein YsxE [Schinkia azotoformans]KEF39478.1 spore coat protein YsxE [Schinkia azotoformans MEV2011]MEC1696861.1 spore coat protein YsxE [Schinkia azotoformans]MEC1718129.1 spore coat protein YsxE [Schinkia azotoformans]MEC1726606.1 spore coat protein YsxE [Schinkia azotoformans]MEC1742109.1 spore coat protein YsxE [Schinkia azotoformans]